MSERNLVPCLSLLVALGCGGLGMEGTVEDPAPVEGDGDGGRGPFSDAGPAGDGDDATPGDGDGPAGDGDDNPDQPSDAGAVDMPPPSSGASQAKKRVLAYFEQISGTQALAGIENKFNTDPRGHSDEVAGLAGKTPAFWGADFGFGAEAVDNRDAIVAEAKKQWAQGAIVALMYHTCVPTRDEYCDWDDIGGKHPVHLTDSQWDELFSEGTAIHDEWRARLDRLAGHFQALKDAGVAPLFRPLHEMNQCAFWWSCKDGENGTVKLWRTTYDYLTKVKGLDHIVWVWNVQDFTSLGEDAVKLHPGVDYFDLATLDIYNTGFTTGNYQTMLTAAQGKPIGIGEVQFLPSDDVLKNQPDWTFFMLWPDFIYEQRNLDIYTSLFASERVVTLDEMPGWD
jgi:hypothetical protein